MKSFFNHAKTDLADDSFDKHENNMYFAQEAHKIAFLHTI